MAIKSGQVQEPAFSRLLFGDTRLALLWLVMRLYCGWAWLASGWQKLQDPLWFGPQAGRVLREFGRRALAATAGDGGLSGLYQTFTRDLLIPYARTCSYVIVIGEVLMGLCLILGVLTGLFAFVSLLFSAGYLFAGVSGLDPAAFVLAIWLTLTWRVAGFWGLDRYMLGYLVHEARSE